jgi:hypothetical protein
LTKNTRDIVISLLALGVIVFGIRYHMMRERLRHADLHAWISKRTQRPLVEICRMPLWNGATFGKKRRKGSRTGPKTIRLRSSSTGAQTRQRAKLAKL